MLEKLLNKINDVEERSKKLISDGKKDAMHIIRIAKEEAETNLESRKQKVESRKKELITKAMAEASEEASRIEKESLKTEAAAASDASKNLPKATKIVVENLNKILCQ